MEKWLLLFPEKRRIQTLKQNRDAMRLGFVQAVEETQGICIYEERCNKHIKT